MGERSSYAPGTFCWSELTSTDQEGSKAFYGALFGWEANDVPVGESATYSMMRLQGRDVAAITGQPQQQRDAGVPSLWNSYVSVASAEQAAARAAELGGNVHAGAFDVMDAGRMAVIQDPQGAYVMVWEARDHHGAGLVNAPGALTWNELQSPDVDASEAFYAGLFGWAYEDAEFMPERYPTIRVGEANNGGIRAAAPGMSPAWLVYFGARDVEASLARALELGASALAGPIDIQIARIAVVRDPQGAVFALYAGPFAP